MTTKLPRKRPLKFTAHTADAEGTVVVHGRRATRQVLKLLPTHRNKGTWSCGLVTMNDINRDRYVIVDHFENGDIIDCMVDTKAGLRELKRFSVKPGVKVVIELTLDGNPHHIAEVIGEVLDAGTLQDAIRDFDPEERPIEVRSALCTSQSSTMIPRAE